MKRDGRGAHGRGRLRIAAASFGLSALLLAASAHPPLTDASWTDPEFDRADITAATLTRPVITGCTTNAGVLGGWSRLTLTWTSPLDTGAQTVNFGPGVLNTSSATRTGPVSGLYTYTLNYTSDLLGGILGSLLGANAIITVKNTYPSGSSWSSTSAQWRFTTTLAGLFPACAPV